LQNKRESSTNNENMEQKQEAGTGAMSRGSQEKEIIPKVRPLAEIPRGRSAETPKNSKGAPTRRAPDSTETPPTPSRGVGVGNVIPRGSHIKVEDWHNNPLSGPKIQTPPPPSSTHRNSASSRPNDIDWPVY